MAKKSSTLPLNLREPPAGMPLYRWLYEELRTAILAGHLSPGSRLPATRDLAAEYKLSRPTIVTAFDQLRGEGYVEGRPGSGTYVSEVLPEEFLQTPRTDARTKRPRRKIRLSAYARRLHPLHRTESRSARAFRASKPALDEFPAALWAQVAARRLRRVSANLLAGEGGMGYHPLREAVAEYLNTSRGVKCSADQVLIISGVQQALDRTAHLLLDAHDPVWLEAPGYPGAAYAFQAVGAKICPVPVDAEGLTVELGERRCARPRLVYVTPAHQFPLGVTMSLRRRLSLLEWARKSGALIFEDDYDSEYRYSGRPIPALQGLDRAGAVIFAGSFSDVLFPALRLGYVVLPSEMVDIFAAAESVSTHQPPLLDQAILCDFINEGHFARHVRRMRELYAERLATLLECARRQLKGLLEIPNVEAGLRTVGWLQNGIRAESAAEAAAARQVEVVPLQRYAWGRADREGLVIGFAAFNSREIRRGVEQLAAALEECRSS
ncbi:MAG TPA: PLP-dependent aminotransferase family protein [Candidatus Acidoferrales bacterium]|nr:PLP-dependent aminotransferase family protein [Candidatus Acidoferrales bacterium]